MAPREGDEQHAAEERDRFASPFVTPEGWEPEYTDGRLPWDWRSRYPSDARHQINIEAWVLALTLLVVLTGASLCLGIAGRDSYSVQVFGAEVSVSFRLLAIFFTGCVGGTTFSIKWLMHSVAKGKWHLDRRYWRLLVPLIGGVYAAVVMTLFGTGLFASSAAASSASPGSVAPVASTAALAFLVGYFSDGVSGLLSNVANAVFGTLEKK